MTNEQIIDRETRKNEKKDIWDKLKARIKPAQYTRSIFRFGPQIYCPGNWERIGKKRPDGTWKRWRRLFFGGRPSAMIERY